MKHRRLREQLRKMKYKDETIDKIVDFTKSNEYETNA